MGNILCPGGSEGKAASQAPGTCLVRGTSLPSFRHTKRQVVYNSLQDLAVAALVRQLVSGAPLDVAQLPTDLQQRLVDAVLQLGACCALRAAAAGRVRRGWRGSCNAGGG